MYIKQNQIRPSYFMLYKRSKRSFTLIMIETRVGLTDLDIDRQNSEQRPKIFTFEYKHKNNSIKYHFSVSVSEMGQKFNNCFRFLRTSQNKPMKMQQNQFCWCHLRFLLWIRDKLQVISKFHE